MSKEPQKDESVTAGEKSKSDFRELYADEASRYDEVRFTSVRGIASMEVKNAAIVRIIEDRIEHSRRAKIIDAASGTGRIVKHLLANDFSDITATDLTREMLHECEVSLNEDELKRVNFEVADMTALPFPDNSFDVATLGSFLYLIPDADYAKFTADLYRVLRPGGVLICDVSNSWGLMSPGLVLSIIKRKILRKKEAKSYINPIEAKSRFGKFKLVGRVGVDYPMLTRNIERHKGICRFLGSYKPMSLMGGKITLILEK